MPSIGKRCNQQPKDVSDVCLKTAQGWVHCVTAMSQQETGAQQGRVALSTVDGFADGDALDEACSGHTQLHGKAGKLKGNCVAAPSGGVVRHRPLRQRCPT